MMTGCFCFFLLLFFIIMLLLSLHFGHNAKHPPMVFVSFSSSRLSHIFGLCCVGPLCPHDQVFCQLSRYPYNVSFEHISIHDLILVK